MPESTPYARDPLVQASAGGAWEGGGSERPPRAGRGELLNQKLPRGGRADDLAMMGLISPCK